MGGKDDANSNKREVHAHNGYFEQIGGHVFTGPVTINPEQKSTISKRFIPLQCPPRVENFVDRKEELAQLLQNLQPGRVVTLCGPGGIGKSALAAEAIWELTKGTKLPADFPDGIIFYSFYNQPQVTLALEHVVRSFGEEPRPTPRDAAQRVLGRRKVLLILDGTENADELQTVLEVRSKCGVLVTSRRRKDAVAERHDMKPLELGEAVKLLRAWGGELAADTAAIEQICKLVGGLPLAVRLVGRYLGETGESAAEYLKWLEETPLQALNQGKRRKESVPLLLERSLAKVSKETPQTLTVLAVVGLLALAPFERDMVVAALNMPEPQIRKILGLLVNYGLLLKEQQYYQVSHILIHTYARRQLAVPEGTIERLGNYFSHFVQEHQKAYTELEVTQPHIMTIINLLKEKEIWQPIVEMAHVITRSRDEGFLQIRGYWNDEENCLYKAIGACEHLKKEADTNQKLHWSHHMADLKFGLGDFWFYKDQYDQAADAFYESLNLYKQFDDCQLEFARTNLKLGEIQLHRGELDQALESFENSLSICKQIGEHGKTLASTYLWLGSTYRRKEAYEEALINYEKSLVYYQDEGDEAECAFVLIRLGSLAFDKGEEEKAWAHLKQTENLINEAKGNPRLIARVRRHLANQYLWKKNFKKAEELHLLSLQDFKSLIDKRNIAWSLQNLGDTYFEKGNDQKAEEYYHEALKYFEELGILNGRGYAFDHLGQIRLRQKKIRDARTYFEKGLEMFKESGLKSGIGFIFSDLGDLERSKGELKRAIKNYRMSLNIWEELENTKEIKHTRKRLQEVIEHDETPV